MRHPRPALRKQTIAIPGYPNNVKSVCTRMSSAAPTINAARINPVVISIATFWALSIRNSVSVGLTLMFSSALPSESRILFKRLGSAPRNCSGFKHRREHFALTQCGLQALVENRARIPAYRFVRIEIGREVAPHFIQL